MNLIRGDKVFNSIGAQDLVLELRNGRMRQGFMKSSCSWKVQGGRV
ncbi:hypothetical protein IC582_010240 [Cucumis melo]